jgi:hypothetical protein
VAASTALKNVNGENVGWIGKETWSDKQEADDALEKDDKESELSESGILTFSKARNSLLYTDDVKQSLECLIEGLLSTILFSVSPTRTSSMHSMKRP